VIAGQNAFDARAAVRRVWACAGRSILWQASSLGCELKPQFALMVAVALLRRVKAVTLGSAMFRRLPSVLSAATFGFAQCGLARPTLPAPLMGGAVDLGMVEAGRLWGRVFGPARQCWVQRDWTPMGARAATSVSTASGSLLWGCSGAYRTLAVFCLRR